MLVVFQIMFLPLYFIQRVTRCSFVLASLLFGAWGCFNEFILAGRIHQLSGAILLLMVSLCFLIYSVMAILPSYYLGAALKGDMRSRQGGPFAGALRRSPGAVSRSSFHRIGAGVEGGPIFGV